MKDIKRKMKDITDKITAQVTAVLPVGDPDVAKLPGLSMFILDVCSPRLRGLRALL